MEDQINKYFSEYNQMCKDDDKLLNTYVAGIDAILPNVDKMTIEELAPYADYVITNMCTESNEIFLELAEMMLPFLDESKIYPTPSALFNISKLVVEMKRRDVFIPKNTEDKIREITINSLSVLHS